MAKKKERDGLAILEEIQTASNEYAKLASDPKTAQGKLMESAQKVKDLRLELDKTISKGAADCPNCGQFPMGMLKTPAFSFNGVDFPNVWEVGCIFCDPYLVERPDGRKLEVDGKPVTVKRISYSARGLSPEEAVQKWNAGQYVEDFLFDRIPNFTPVYIDE